MKIRYITALVIMILYNVCSCFCYYSNGALKAYIMQELSLRESSFSLISSATILGYTMMQLPMGSIMDKNGVKRTAIFGCILQMVGTGLMVIGPSAVIIALGRLLQGIGGSVGLLGAYKLCSLYFSESVYGILTGITLCVSMMGAVFAQTPFAWVLEHITWRKFFLGYEGMLVFLLFMIFLGIPKGQGSKTLVERLHINRNVWLCTLTGAFLYGGYGIITGIYGIGMIQEAYQCSSVKASGFMSIALIGCCIGNVLVGIIADRFRKKKSLQLIITMGYTMVLGGICFELGIKKIMPISILFFLYGIFECAYLTCYIIAKESSVPEYTGTVVAIVNTGCYLGSVMAIFIINILYSATGIQTGTLAAGVSLIMGVLAVISTAFVQRT